MLNTLKLLLPALIPSWRFFAVISASPRIEITKLQTDREQPSDWKEVRLQPKRVSFRIMIKRLFWNPRRNETLFLVTCAERIMDDPTEHCHQEILKRAVSDLELDSTNKAPLPPYLQFRLVFVSRGQIGLERQVRYISPIYQIRNGAE